MFDRLVCDCWLSSQQSSRVLTAMRPKAAALAAITPQSPFLSMLLNRNLRTNLPREIMGYRALPFIPEALGKHYSRDPRRFCSHEEVRVL